MRTLAEYESALKYVLGLIAKETHFQCAPGLAEVFSQHPRLVVAVHHGTPLGWLPSAALLGMEALRAGGGGRTPVGVMDHLFYQVPFVREVVQWLTQADRPLSFEELKSRFMSRSEIDLMVFPEGSNCFFGAPDEIQDFRSPKFVELSILSGAPILLGVHRGSESWSLTFPVSEDLVQTLEVLPAAMREFLERRLLKTGLFTLPVFPSPMARFEMRCELYFPQLAQSELAEAKEMRSQQLAEEAERVRARMGRLRDQFFLT